MGPLKMEVNWAKKQIQRLTDKQKCAAYNLIKTGTFIQMLNLVYYLSHKAA